MKKFLCLFLIVSIVCSLFSFAPSAVFAATGAADIKFSYKNGTLTVLGSGNMTDSHAGYWSKYSSDVTKVVINDGVTSIGKKAFKDFPNLKTVSMPDTITLIEDSAFENCIALTDITLSAGLESLGARAFYGCSALGGIEVPSGVGVIKTNTFFGCTSLKSAVIPKSVTGIENYAFQNCSSLTDVSITYKTTSIGSDVFSGCTSLEEITLPSGLTEISDGLFYGCTSLKTVTLPSTATIIGNSAFCGCSSLTSITIPDTVTEIASRAFVNCSSLTSIVIGKGVTRLEDDTFTGCTALADITFRGTVSYIGSVGITDTAYYKNNSNWSGGALYLSKYLMEVNKDEVSGHFAVKAGTVGIANSAFSDCESLTSVSLPSSLIYFGKQAFARTGLTEVTIPSNVETIEGWAFAECESLTSVTINEGTTTIGQAAFDGCTVLREITIPSSVTQIAWWAFSGCESLDNVYYASDKAAWNEISISSENESLTDATIHYNRETSAAMSGTCGTNARWNVYRGAITISGTGAVNDYTKSCSYPWKKISPSLVDVVFEDGITSVGNYAFLNIDGIERVDLSGSVTSVGEGAFSGCSGLTRVTIGENTESIGNNAFYNCTDLTDVFYLGSEEEWNKISIGSGNDSLVQAVIHCLDIDCSDYVDSGMCGDDIVWCLDTSGVLTLSGTGNMKNYNTETYYRTLPWYKYRSSITSAVIDSEITSIGLNAFGPCSGLTHVYYAGSEDMWNEVEIYGGNSNLSDAEIIFLADTPEPITVEMAENGDTLVFYISVLDEYVGNTLYIAVYNKRGALVGYNEVENCLSGNIVFVDKADDAALAKVFIWSGGMQAEAEAWSSAVE